MSIFFHLYYYHFFHKSSSHNISTIYTLFRQSGVSILLGTRNASGWTHELIVIGNKINIIHNMSKLHELRRIKNKTKIWLVFFFENSMHLCLWFVATPCGYLALRTHNSNNIFLYFANSFITLYRSVYQSCARGWRGMRSFGGSGG